MSTRRSSIGRGKMRLVAGMLEGIVGCATFCIAAGMPLTEMEARGRHDRTRMI